MADAKQRTAFEQHFTPQELGTLWGFSGRFVRELFINEPGIVEVERPERMHKRRHRSIRIPESLAQRVYARLKKAA